MTEKIHFIPRPTEREAKQNYAILRANREQKFRLRFFCLSDDILGLEIHYAGRSIPCTSYLGSCKWCDLGRAKRWVGYIPACCEKRQNLFLAEVTPGVVPAIDRYVQQFGSLRGAYITLSRPTMRDNGRLDAIIQPLGSTLAPGDLPLCFDAVPVLAKIFGIDDVRKSLEPTTCPVLQPACEVVTSPDSRAADDEKSGQDANVVNRIRQDLSSSQNGRH